MCLYPSFAREIDTPPSTKEKRIEKLFKAGKVPQEFICAHQKKTPQAINVIPSNNAPPGFINGFNGSSVLDEIGNSNFLIISPKT